MMTLAQQYIDEFRQGNEFPWGADVTALTLNFRPDPSALYILKKELSIGNASVRENIVQLLNAIGLACDPPSPERVKIIRDRDIIRALLIEGYAKDDTARYDSAKLLHTQCTQSDLAAFDNFFLHSLQSGSTNYLLLIAKAKTSGALSMVEKIAGMPDFRGQENNRRIVRIAEAALGNLIIEEEFLNATIEAEKTAPPAPKNRFYDVRDARDGSAVATLLKQLGQIGTHRSMLLVCTFLRSRLKSYVRDVSERMIRDDAVAAIRFNFPDQRILYEPSSLAEWAAVENFCSQHLGAVFDGPTPNLPRANIYPLHSLGRASQNR